MPGTGTANGSPAPSGAGSPAAAETQSGSPGITRAETLAAIALGLFSVAWLTFEIGDLASNSDLLAGAAGEDFFVLRAAAASWLSGGPFYHPTQLEGPYGWPGPWILYPPPVLVLLVPFVWLPAAIWWIVPVATVALVAAQHRPRPLALAVMLFCMVNPSVLAVVFWGNPTMWTSAALALGTRYAWPAVLILIKPSLLPFAILGASRRSWWIALAGLAAISLLFLPMWPAYLTVVANARPEGGVLYSLPHVPAMLIPLAAWAGRRRNVPIRASPGSASAG